MAGLSFASGLEFWSKGMWKKVEVEIEMLPFAALIDEPSMCHAKISKNNRGSVNYRLIVFCRYYLSRGRGPVLDNISLFLNLRSRVRAVETC